jgi:hypothetical protein
MTLWADFLAALLLNRFVDSVDRSYAHYGTTYEALSPQCGRDKLINE